MVGDNNGTLDAVLLTFLGPSRPFWPHCMRPARDDCSKIGESPTHDTSRFVPSISEASTVPRIDCYSSFSPLRTEIPPDFSVTLYPAQCARDNLGRMCQNWKAIKAYVGQQPIQFQSATIMAGTIGVPGLRKGIDVPGLRKGCGPFTSDSEDE